jgi:GNAT superfamily N-acetyltransferase
VIFVDAALARRIEDADAATGIATAQRQSEAAAVEEIGGGWAIFVAPGSPINRAAALGLHGPVTAADLDRVEAFFRERGAPVQLDLCPFADPSLLEALAGRRYHPVEFNSVLVKPLAGEAPYPPDPRVREAVPDDEEAWARTAAAGFFERDEPLPAEIEVGRTVFRTPGARCFVACQGEPGAVAGVSIRGGLAILYADGTVPRFRRLGLQSALIRERVNLAIREGCDLATASTMPGAISQRNYERLGFRVVYTKVVLVG